MAKGQRKEKTKANDHTEELLIREIERLISDISNSVIDDMSMMQSFPGVSYGQTLPNMTTIQSNGYGGITGYSGIGLTGGVGQSGGPSGSPSLTLLDVYERLQETKSEINKTLRRFRISLDKATDTNMINSAIVNFTTDFYRLRDTLNSQMAIYNTVYFTTSEEVAIGEQYMDQCFKGVDKDICLAKLVKDGLTS